MWLAVWEALVFHELIHPFLQGKVVLLPQAANS